MLKTVLAFDLSPKWLLSKTRFLTCLVIQVFLFFFLSTSQAEQGADFKEETRKPINTPVILAVVNSYGNVSDHYFQSTVKRIQEAILPYKLEVRRYTQTAFLDAASHNDFDLAIASSGLTSISIERYGGTPLLWQVSYENPNPDRGAGSALIVRGDNDSIKNISDLKGKTFAIMSKSAFSGFMIPTVELYRKGIDLETVAKDFVITPNSMRSVFDKVKNGEADVGIVVTCMKEALIRDKEIGENEFKVLFPQKDKDFFCEHSTNLYPSWILSSKRSLPSHLAKKIVQALMAMPPDEERGTHWTISTDDAALRELFATIKGRYPEKVDILQLLSSYKWVFAGILAVIVGFIINSLILVDTVRKRTKEAELLVKAKMQVEVDNVRNIARIESMQKASTVGVISSMVAHELKQPLAVINNYAEALKRRLKKGTEITPEVLSDVVEKIGRESIRASEILAIVRNYGKTMQRSVGKTDICELIHRLIDLVSHLNQRDLKVTYEGPDHLFVSADKLELELIFINLLKNAREAQSSLKEKRIDVRITQDARFVYVDISDHGPKLSEEAFKKVGNFGMTSKENGLGFGLSIVKELLEPYAGSLNITQKPDRGLSCTVKNSSGSLGKY